VANQLLADYIRAATNGRVDDGPTAFPLGPGFAGTEHRCWRPGTAAGIRATNTILVAGSLPTATLVAGTGCARVTSTDDLRVQVLDFITCFNGTLTKPFIWTDLGKPLHI
jgi:hypothetical protein